MNSVLSVSFIYRITFIHRMSLKISIRTFFPTARPRISHDYLVFYSLTPYSLFYIFSKMTENPSTDFQITELQAWTLAFSFADADITYFFAILNREIDITSPLAGTLIPLPAVGPSHPFLQHISILPTVPTDSHTLLKSFLQLRLLLSVLPNIERRIIWLNGSLERRLRPLHTIFRSTFKDSPSPTHFAHMATILRLCHQILAFLDIKYPCFLEAPNPLNSAPTPPGPCISFTSWSFPPRHVDPTASWQPASWPNWRFWPNKPIAKPTPLTVELFNPLQSSRWISTQRVLGRAAVLATRHYPSPALSTIRGNFPLTLIFIFSSHTCFFTCPYFFF